VCHRPQHERAYEIWDIRACTGDRIASILQGGEDFVCTAQQYEVKRPLRSRRHRDRRPVWIAELEPQGPSTDDRQVKGRDLLGAGIVGRDRAKGLTYRENRLYLVRLAPTVVGENERDDVSAGIGLGPGEDQFFSAKVLVVRAERKAWSRPPGPNAGPEESYKHSRDRAGSRHPSGSRVRPHHSDTSVPRGPE